MRIVLSSLVLLCATPALAQSPADLDARCVSPGPGRPSYEPPLWLGDDPPRSTSASMAERRADRLTTRFGQSIPLHWVRHIAEYRWEQCLLGSDPAPCREGIALYERSLQERGYQPPTSRPDQVLFRLATLLVRTQRWARAREVLERLIKDFPASSLTASALILLGQSHVLVRDPATAERYFTRAADLASPHQSTAFYLAAWAARDAGHSPAAAALAARALTTARGEVRQALRDDWCALRS